VARDVEVNVTANDRTGNGLASAERSFKRTGDKIKKEGDDNAKKYSSGFLRAVESVAPKLASQLATVGEQAGQAAGPLLGAGLAAASPLIAATVSAAIAAGVGVGVAGIGVALVSQDARVQAAGKQLGAHLMDSLQQDAAPFIGPVLDGIDQIETAFDSANGRIQNIFRNASKFVGPLVDGATRGLDGIIRGVDELVAKSQPVIDALGRSLGDLGNDFGDFLAGIDAQDAATSIDALTTSVGGLLAILGPTLNVLTKVYGFLDTYAPSALSLVGKLTKDQGTFAQRTAGQTDELSTSFQKATEDTVDYAAGLAQAQAAVQGLYSSNRDLYSSTTSVASAFADANKAAKENGRTLNLNTKEGRANRDSLSSVAGQLNRNYESYVKVNGEGAGAAKLASTLRSRFIALAEKMGASSSKARALAGSLLGIPNVKRDVTVRTEAAKSAAQALKERLAGIKDRTVYVNVAFNQGRLNKVEAQLSRINRAALAGGPGGWGAVDGGAGSRTGGAQPVNVTSKVDVRLDGQPFRQLVATAVSDSESRTAWRARAGRR
jgi:hypothetical protein